MRRALKFSAWAAGGSVLLILLIVAGAVFIAGNTDSGRVMIERVDPSTHLRPRFGDRIGWCVARAFIG